MRNRMIRTTLATSAVLMAVTAATAAPAAAQGDPVFGFGNAYYYSGAYDDDGIAQAYFVWGDLEDETYVGDWYGEGVDAPMVRRGNTFFVGDAAVVAGSQGTARSVFAYGNDDDEIYVGDWDGDGRDSLAVRRGNQYFIKNDVLKSGVADTVIAYGNDDDVVLTGNWNGVLTPPSGTTPGKGDTLLVRRDGHYFVKNDLVSGVADADFYFGDADDEVLAGDWPEVEETATEITVASGDGADQLVVRRDFSYFLSVELPTTGRDRGVATGRTFYYGDAEDYVFVAKLPTLLDAEGRITDDPDRAVDAITGDGLGVRR